MWKSSDANPRNCSSAPSRLYWNTEQSDLIIATFRLVDATNRYVTLAAPWDLVRDGQTERAAVVLRTSLEALHAIARELAPFLPATSDELRMRLQAPAFGGETRWNVLLRDYAGELQG